MGDRWEELCEKARAQGNHYEDRLIAAGLMACNRIDALEAEVERLRELVETTCNEFAEEIKHTSHMDGLGMGDQRSESVVLALKYRLREAQKEESDG